MKTIEIKQDSAYSCDLSIAGYLRRLFNKLTGRQMKEKNPILEAHRYLDNARQTLSEKAGKSGDRYTDKKYVKAAGNYAWGGVLEALDGVLKVKENLKKGQRADFKDYQMAMAKVDRKMSGTLLDAYDTLHKTLGYDGNLRYEIVQSGLKQALEIIDWAEKRYNGDKRLNLD